MDISKTLDTKGMERADLFIDYFKDDRSAGSVIGIEANIGVVRKGIDKEGVIGIDNGSLRIQPLVKPGWGRSGIAYGPYTRKNGLAFGTFLTNGHNISQVTALPDGFKSRLVRWILGSETEKPIMRIIRWVGSRQKKFMWRRFLHWVRHGTRFFRVTPLRENLAVGWFPSEVPENPLSEGNSLVVHALTSEGGELWARIGMTFAQTVRGLQNIPMYYVVVLREQGAAYYAASLPRVPGVKAFPKMRLLAIDAMNEDKTIYAGIHQSVLGEIGFRVDTRVHRTQVLTISEFSKWYGSAHGADTLTGDGPLHLSHAETGESWTVYEGKFIRTSQGLTATEKTNLAMLFLQSPPGFLHLLIKTTDMPVQGIGLIWRAKDEHNCWVFEVGDRQCQLSIKKDGEWRRLPVTKDHHLLPNSLNYLQVADDGENIRLYLNGGLVYGTTLVDTFLQDGIGVGFRVLGGGMEGLLCSFEAHPRDIPIPEAFDFEAPWFLEGDNVLIQDHFDGEPVDLSGRTVDLGIGTWRREIGQGTFQLTGEGAVKVLATAVNPCPGRTAYTVEWPNPNFADVKVKVTPPGIGKGMKEMGRGGLIFWQDSRNYISLSLFLGDYPAMSIAAFFYLDGYEELYDAVWTNIGKRIYWGVPYDFRVVFDGKRFLAFVNEEPVLYRVLSDVYPDWEHFLINRVGIVANWEWGNDTGSVFQDFVAKDRG